MLPVLPWLTCLLLAIVPARTGAQTAIHRCVGANGGPVFTDQPCAALQAVPVTAQHAPTDKSERPSTPAVLCAADADQLRRAVIDAFADADANRLAGLMLWRGTGDAAAVADIRDLAQAMRAPLLDIAMEPEAGIAATTAPGLSSALARPAGEVLVVRTAGRDGSGQPYRLRFTVVRRFGCLWLRSAD